MTKASGEWRLRNAPADGTEKINWRGEAVTDPVTHKLCKNLTNKTLKVVPKTDNCGTNFEIFGAIKNTDIVWLSKALLFLAKNRQDGNLDDNDVLDLADTCGAANGKVLKFVFTRGQPGACGYSSTAGYCTVNEAGSFLPACHSVHQVTGECTFGVNCPSWVTLDMNTCVPSGQRCVDPACGGTAGPCGP
jgi:hypothetical protein